MITADRLTDIGTVLKPHGIKGELSVKIDDGLDPDDLKFIFMNIDGLYVPYFIEAYRPKGDHWLLKLEGVEDEKQADRLSSHDVYAVTDELPDEYIGQFADGVSLEDLEGFTLLDAADESPVGVIEHIDDTTINVFFHVQTPDGKCIFVPYADELVTALDPEAKTIELEIPQGIKDIN